MPLSRARMRERKKQDRLVKPSSLNVKPKLIIRGLSIEGNRIIGAVKPKQVIHITPYSKEQQLKKRHK